MRRYGLTALIAVLAVLILSTQGLAEKSKPSGLKIGEAAPSFELSGNDNQTHTLADYKGKIVVVYFHSVQCPWAKAYQPILNAAAAKFAKTEHDGKPATPVVFVGINSNSTEDMKAIDGAVKEYKIEHVILKDPGNKIADAYGAQTTPHIYIIDAEGKLRYVGGLEKAPSDPSGSGKSKEQYLEPTLAAMVIGKDPPQSETVAVGCSIKRERKKAS